MFFNGNGMKRLPIILVLFMGIIYNNTVLSMKGDTDSRLYKKVLDKFLKLHELSGKDESARILQELLCVSVCEPELDFIKRHLEFLPQQDLYLAIFQGMKKGFWTTVTYLLDVYTFEDWQLKNIALECAKFGKIELLKQLFLLIQKDKEILELCMKIVVKNSGSLPTMKFLVSLYQELRLDTGADFLQKLFFSAIKYGQYKIVQFFVKKFTVLFERGLLLEKNTQQNALHIAVTCKNNIKKMVEFFLHRGVDPYARDYKNQTPLQQLLFSKTYFTPQELEVVRLFLKTERYSANEIYVPSLICATEELNYYKNIALQEIQQSQDTSLYKKYTLSNLICENKQVPIKKVQQLLEQEEEQNYYRAVQEAIDAERLDLVDFLLNVANKYVDHDIYALLLFAICNEKCAMAKELCYRVPAFSAQDLKLLFSYVARVGSLDMLHFFLEGIGAHSPFIFRLCLKGAAKYGHLLFIKKLMTLHNFSVIALQEAALLAASSGHMDLVTLLYEHCDIKTKNLILKDAFINNNKEIIVHVIRDLKHACYVEKKDLFNMFVYKKKILTKKDEDVFNACMKYIFTFARQKEVINERKQQVFLDDNPYDAISGSDSEYDDFSDPYQEFCLEEEEYKRSLEQMLHENKKKKRVIYSDHEMRICFLHELSCKDKKKSRKKSFLKRNDFYENFIFND